VQLIERGVKDSCSMNDFYADPRDDAKMWED
jgi:hypothetical protein